LKKIQGLAVLINRIGKPDVTVGVDGSLYRYHPRFKRNMERCMETLVHKDIKVRDYFLSETSFYKIWR
jgi:hypothetical protein